MRSNAFVILAASLFFFSCVNQNNKPSTMKNRITFNINSDSVSYIKVIHKDDVYKIENKGKINSILYKMNDSKIDYIKFGSNNIFIIYDVNNNKLVKAFFREDKFKIKGVVYKTKSILFE